MFKLEHVVLAVALAAAGGCATAPIPYKAPVSATPPTGQVIVNQAVNLLDSSGSEETLFPDAKAALESIVGVMPNGTYDAGHIHFGGFEREATGLAPFNRSTLAAAAKNAAWLEGTTPIASVIEKDLTGLIGSAKGRAAVVLISDGRATDYAGRDGMGDGAVAAAQALAQGRTGDTCFHTIQTGDDPAGAATLQAIANVSKCGSFRSVSSLASASALQQFSRDVYLGAGPAPAPAPLAAAPGDADGDGVLDPNDACPNTLAAARVDGRGCWTLQGLRFAVNSAEIDRGYTTMLHEAIDVLKANPDVRISIDGHTDSDGSDAYNQGLSERRAASVLDYFVTEGGLERARFVSKGYGESRAAVANDTRENKALNRRVELTILD
ncbi:MAG: OmpA family protein [Deltaproteobacteria bacterium]|nr:OmpA family protein [Deltaproteobacteria bacterium]